MAKSEKKKNKKQRKFMGALFDALQDTFYLVAKKSKNVECHLENFHGDSAIILRTANYERQSESNRSEVILHLEEKERPFINSAMSFAKEADEILDWGETPYIANIKTSRRGLAEIAKTLHVAFGISADDFFETLKNVREDHKEMRRLERAAKDALQAFPR